MKKYQAKLLFEDGEEIVSDYVFDSYQEAFDDACEMLSDYSCGGEVLEMSNPGDYPYDEEEDVEYEIMEIDD